MKTRTKLLIGAGAIAVVAGALSVGAGFAHDHGQGHHGWHHGEGRGGPGGSLFESFDANDDGRLTQAEIDGVRNERFAEFDRDGDGRLSLEEYQALWLDAMRPRMVDRFQAHDEDGDAAVTAEEFASPLESVVDRWDRNGDGELTTDELRPGPRGDHRRGDHRRGDHDRNDG